MGEKIKQEQNWLRGQREKKKSKSKKKEAVLSEQRILISAEMGVIGLTLPHEIRVLRYIFFHDNTEKIKNKKVSKVGLVSLFLMACSLTILQLLHNFKKLVFKGQFFSFLLVLNL